MMMRNEERRGERERERMDCKDKDKDINLKKGRIANGQGSEFPPTSSHTEDGAAECMLSR